MSQPGAVPRRWPGSTIICLAPGPSLTSQDVEACRGRVPVVAVNDGYQSAPWADVIYAADTKWWKRSPRAWALPALKFAMPPVECDIPGLTILGNVRQDGMTDNPHAVCSGGHSGYSAINVAKHLIGPGGRIVLLGYDMQLGPHGEHHCFGEHPDRSYPRFARWIPLYRTLTALLGARGITLVNATRETAIPWIPRMDLQDALQETPCHTHRP